MSPYEIALLVFAILVICILVWDNHKIRGRLERSEADIIWLKKAVKNTVDVHQKVMDGHTRDIKRLDEQTTKFAARIQGKLNELPDFVRLNATVDRLQKSSMYRDTASRAAMQRMLEDGQAELRREVYVDGEMAAGIGSEAERTRTAGDPDGAGR